MVLFVLFHLNDGEKISTYSLHMAESGHTGRVNICVAARETAWVGLE